MERHTSFSSIPLQIMFNHCEQLSLSAELTVPVRDWPVSSTFAGRKSSKSTMLHGWHMVAIPHAAIHAGGAVNELYIACLFTAPPSFRRRKPLSVRPNRRVALESYDVLTEMFARGDP